MKPERLVMQAFGPYSGRQVLDFAELGRFGFFLIHGPTGAGKTTILDAMVFALYGDTSGGAATDKGARRADDMRSDHASHGLPTEARFDFAVGARRYRVVRRPDQQRPRVRGEGTVLDKKTAALWDRSGLAAGDLESDGAPLATKWGEVTRRVEDILGFRSVQFRQVVMLPQGKFQELLQAKSDEREEILQRLFRTERYLELQQALKAEAQVSGKELQLERDRRSLVLEQSGSASADELAGTLDGLQAEVAAADAAVRAASAAETAALAALTEARSVADRLDELAEARREHDELAVGREACDECRAEVRLARAAAELAGLDAAAHDRRNDLTPKLLALELAETTLATATADRQGAARRLAVEQARESQRVTAAERVRELDDLVGKAEQVAAALSLREESAREVAAAEAAQVAAERRAGASRAAAKEACENAARELVALEQAWSQGQAAILAAALAPSEPCPVCGSTDHPRPAASAVDLPCEAGLLAARRAVSESRDAYDETRDTADEALAASARRVAAAQAAHATESAVLAERERDVPQGLRDPEALAAELDEARAELLALDEAWQAAQHADREADAALAAATGALAAARCAHDELAGVLAQLERDRRAAIAAAGFADEQAYFAARREPHELAALEKRVADHDNDSAAAAARLQRAAAAAGACAPRHRGALVGPRNGTRCDRYGAPAGSRAGRPARCSRCCRSTRSESSTGASATAKTHTRSSAAWPRSPRATTRCASRSSATCSRPISTMSWWWRRTVWRR